MLICGKQQFNWTLPRDFQIKLQKRLLFLLLTTKAPELTSFMRKRGFSGGSLILSQGAYFNCNLQLHF